MGGTDEDIALGDMGDKRRVKTLKAGKENNSFSLLSIRDLDFYYYTRRYIGFGLGVEDPSSSTIEFKGSGNSPHVLRVG
jgi:hypothetical protein